MSVASVLRACDYDPTRDTSYQATRLGRSVADFLAWKRIQGRAERTLDQYERDLARGCLMFPSKGLEEFGDSELTHVAASFSPAQRRTRMEAYRSFFNWAFKTRRLSGFNPMHAMPDIQQPARKTIDVFNDTEIELLCGLPNPDGVLFQILFDEGLRKGEVRHLQVKHFHDGVVDVTGKGGKQRIVPVTMAVSHKLDELVTLDGLNSTDYLWYTRPGGHDLVRRNFPVGDTSFQTWWVRCLAAAHVRHRKAHTTRHTMATRYLRRGGSMERLARILGHASIRTTDENYTHLNTQDLADEFALLFDSPDALNPQLED